MLFQKAVSLRQTYGIFLKINLPEVVVVLVVVVVLLVVVGAGVVVVSLIIAEL